MVAWRRAVLPVRSEDPGPVLSRGEETTRVPHLDRVAHESENKGGGGGGGGGGERAHVRVVVSLLRSAENAAEFLEVSRDFRQWLDAQPGFLTYELIGSGRRWTDRMEWASTQAAESGDRAFAQTALPARFGSLVERYMVAAGEVIDFST